MSAKKSRKPVGENIAVGEASWTFGGDTPGSFNEHVRRSVPFYDESHDLICKLSDYFVQDEGTCYELGASTGVLMKKLARRHANRKGVRWVGIDREEAMIEHARTDDPVEGIEFVVEDLNAYPFEKSDLVVSYCTMQFVSPHVRQDIYNRIYESLKWGGALILFEKVRACDARFQDMMQTLYADYKLDKGYSPEEIVAKTKSLKGVLEPFSRQGNLDLLKRAGFVDVMTVFKYICFEGFLAIK
ncbi:methyltransferase domain-containing protein [Verrucomicrobiota bacterium]